MVTMVIVLTEKMISLVASETGRTELEVIRMLKKADAIGHRCIFFKVEGEEWTYNLVHKSTSKSKLASVA